MADLDSSIAGLGGGVGDAEASLKVGQLRSVTRMLGFNSDSVVGADGAESSSFGMNQWKILIYDAACRSIISPLLSVSQLRRLGVTLHLMINSERDPIPDVPVVYFVEPTRANLSMIAADCAKKMYGPAYLNFVTKLERPLMEEFARLLIGSNSLNKVATVFDQYLDYVCLERTLFSLNKTDSYVTYNQSSVTEQMIEGAMNDIAYGLFSVVATLGKVPVIRCPKGGAPEMVARKLCRMIADHPVLSRGRGGGFVSSASAAATHHRPLLVILDRNSDLITPVQHTATYQALIDDLLDHHANRVEFVPPPEKDPSTGRPIRSRANQKKRFDLDADTDPFYSHHKFNPFPEAIESNGTELQDVTNREAEIRSKTSTSTPSGNADPLSSSAADLVSTVDSLPKLLERKKQLEVHTSILQAVMNQVAARDVPQFYELESSLATGSFKNDLAKAKKEILDLVTDPSKGDIEDKFRLVVVYCLATKAPSADIDEVTTKLKDALETKGTSASTDAAAAASGRGLLSREDRVKLDAGIKSIEYIKRLRSMQMISAVQDSDVSTSTSSSKGGSGSELFGFMANQATGLLGKAIEKVGTVLGKVHKNPATRVVENLCDMKPNTEDDSYLYLDPKVKGGDVDMAALRGVTRAQVREVIFFVVGGGCYGEYQNLQMLSNERRRITYGSTEIVDPCVFLRQLSKLA